jgi:hypothetical protein
VAGRNLQRGSSSTISAANDPMNTGMLNLVERICGGNLYHCFICRIQFYDRRPLGQGLNRPGISRPSALPVNRRSVPLTIQPDTARSDA